MGKGIFGVQGLHFAFLSCAVLVNAAANCLSLKLGMVCPKTDVSDLSFSNLLSPSL